MHNGQGMYRAQTADKGGLGTGVQLVGGASNVDVPLELIVPNPTTTQTTITSTKQNMLDCFSRLVPSRVLGNLRKDAFESLNSCEDRLHTLRLVKLRRVDYATF